MAGPHGQPWSTAEKNYLLAEIIKAQYPHPNYLLNVINQLGIQPNWEEIPMPPGRTLNSCRAAFESLRRTPAAAMLQGSMGPQTPSPMSAGISSTLKRPYEGSFPAGREIRPKPLSALGGYGQMSTIENPPKKKRGRPTKAEAREKAEAQIASSGPTPRSDHTTPYSAGSAGAPSTETQSPILQLPSEPPRPTVAPTQPMQRVTISSILGPNASPDVSQPGSSSSGKRKRARSTMSEPEQFPIAERASFEERNVYESPYARTGLGTQETPARAAFLRHREEAQSQYPETNIPESEAQAPRPTPPDTGTRPSSYPT